MLASVRLCICHEEKTFEPFVVQIEKMRRGQDIGPRISALVVPQTELLSPGLQDRHHGVAPDGRLATEGRLGSTDIALMR